MTSSARQLLDLISNSLTLLEKSCEARSVDIPDLNSPFHPSTEAFRADPTASEAANVISAAALQLAAIFVPPQVSVFRAIGGVSFLLVRIKSETQPITVYEVCCYTCLPRVKCH